jgi:hypothetical protein
VGATTIDGRPPALGSAEVADDYDRHQIPQMPVFGKQEVDRMNGAFRRSVASVLVLLATTATILFARFDLASSQKYWRYSSPEISLGQTGQSAKKQSPECGEGPDGIAAVEVVAKAGASVLDKYLATKGIPSIGGYGITDAVLKAVSSDGNKQWLRDRLGIGGGLSKCATQCVIYPTPEASRLSVYGCISETGGDGLDCGADGWNGQWRGAYNLTHANTGQTTVSCMTGKNWSGNRDRRFWVVAVDVNPLDGSRLARVYR